MANKYDIFISYRHKDAGEKVEIESKAVAVDRIPIYFDRFLKIMNSL